MLKRSCRLKHNNKSKNNILHFSTASLQPQPWNIHPNPNPWDHAQRTATHKEYASPPDPIPYKKTREHYIDINKNKYHLPRYPKNQVTRNQKQKYLDQPSPYYQSDQTSLSIQQIAGGQYLATNKDQTTQQLLLPSSSQYLVDPKRRKSFGIIDDETSHKQIRKQYELIIRQAKSPEFRRKGLDGIMSLSRKLQRLLDQAELLETPKYAFPLFDEIFFGFLKFGIMSDRAYNQMIVQCERREMNSRWYVLHFPQLLSH